VFDIADPSIEAAADTEATILTRLNHPAIVKMKEYFVSRPQHKAYLILERAPGQTLHQVVRETKGLPIKLVKKLFTHLLQAVSYLH
jgi:serine/threonine protein kinase